MGELKKILISAKGEFFRYCRSCISGNPGVPDVFIGDSASGVMTEENIADPKTGQPIPFYDKTSKKAAMKMAGVREAGDRTHGMRPETKRRTYFT